MQETATQIARMIIDVVLFIVFIQFLLHLTSSTQAVKQPACFYGHIRTNTDVVLLTQVR